VAGQSITFDFLSRGSATVAGDFRKVGDNAALASRGAKVLADVIGKLGDKENRTAAESKILARALRETGAAEDRVTARAVLADAAIRRLGDSMKDSQKKSDGLGKALGGLKLNPGLVGPLVALAPAIATLGGVATGAAAGLGGAFIAGGAALAAFGAVAKPVLSDAKKAATAVETAQTAHAAAVAKVTGQYRYAMSVAKTQAQRNAAYAAEQKGFSAAGLAQTAALSKAYANLSPAQIALSKQIGAMADSWDKVKAAQTPVVAGALQPWLKSVTDLTKNLGPIIAHVSPVIASLGGQFGGLINSSAFRGFRDFIGSTGSAAVSATGSTLIDFVKGFITLLPKFDPLIREAVGWISRLGPAFATWAASKKSSDEIQHFMQWFSQNGPVVGGLLKNIGGALAALAPGLTSGGALELKVVSDFLGFVAKLPPVVAKPLAEVAGAALILSKMGGGKVISFLVTGALGGIFGKGGVAAAAGGAAQAGGAASLWSRLTPGARLAGGALAMTLIVDAVLKGTPSGKGKNWFDNPFGMPGPKDKASANNWLTSWSPYINRFKTNISDMTAFVSGSWTKFTVLLSSVFGIAKEHIRITWDQIKILFLQGEDFIVRTMGKLPGPLGAPFRAAHASIQASMAAIQRDVGAATRNIQGDFDRLHGKTVQIHMNGQGLYTITGSIIAASQGKGGSGNAAGGLARGGFITGGTPGRDSVFAALMPGEVVVPTRMVKAGAVDHLRGSLPGFASGGQVSGPLTAPFVSGMYSSFQNRMTGAEVSAMRASLKIAEAAAVAAAKAAASAGVSGAGPVGGDAAANKALARRMFPWNIYTQWGAFDTLEMHEAGYNRFARNRASGAYGIPQALPPTKMPFAAQAAGGSHAGPQLSWMFNYIRQRYGTPANAWAQYYAHPGGVGWYAKGGLVPGFASGGTVGQQGAAYLRAWRTRHGGGFGAAHGPVVLNEQIARMSAAAVRAQALAGASGLSPGQHRFWASAAAGEKKRLAVLHKELTTERAWRYQLELNELGLDREIRAAGNIPSLAGPVKGWKAALGRDKARVAAISKMLGYSGAYLAAHKPPPKVTPPGVPGSIPHAGAYTDSTADLIRQLFASLASSSRVVTLDSGGMVMDSGGWLRPGWNPPSFNGTGRPELLRPDRGGGAGGGTVVLQNHGVIGSQAELEDWLVRSYDNLRRKRRI